MSRAEEFKVDQPSVFLLDPSDDEHTRLTGIAHLAGWNAVEARLTQDREDGRHPSLVAPVQFIETASGDVIVLELHGQSSVTGHGKQGLRPDRIKLLRHLQLDTGIPVYLVFVEGLQSRYEAWLHDLGKAEPVTHGDGATRATMRFGWPVKEMEKRTGMFVLPESVPPRKPRAQETLV